MTRSGPIGYCAQQSDRLQNQARMNEGPERVRSKRNVSPQATTTLGLGAERGEPSVKLAMKRYADHAATPSVGVLRGQDSSETVRKTAAFRGNRARKRRF